MKDALKSINKKYLYIIAGIFGAIILILIIVAISRGCSKPGKNYAKVEEKIVSAARNYYKEHSDMIPKDANKDTVSAATLAETGYMKALSEYLEDTSCTADLTIYNNGGQYLLVPNLVCAEYKTVHLVDKVKEDNLITSTGETTTPTESSQSGGETNNAPVGSEAVNSKDYISGLYEDNGVYVFKGKNPNNYLVLSGITWRILDINENGIMRVIKTDAEKRATYWDTKYNSQENKREGINDYKNSTLREKLYADYAKFKDENKAHLAPFNACVGKRDVNTIVADRNIDCAEVLENQYIGVINSSDFARGSLDENCVNINQAACTNYNYLNNFVLQSWTSNSISSDTYQVIYINSGTASKIGSNKSATYHWVIAINGDEKYISGNGTLNDPYVVGKKSKK